MCLSHQISQTKLNKVGPQFISSCCMKNSSPKQQKCHPKLLKRNHTKQFTSFIMFWFIEICQRIAVMNHLIPYKYYTMFHSKSIKINEDSCPTKQWCFCYIRCQQHHQSLGDTRSAYPSRTDIC